MRPWRIVSLALAACLVLAVWPMSAPAPAHAQDGVIWHVEYYDNPYLSGDPVLTRQEGGREFYWGESSPDASVPVDYFSARFATDYYFEGGNYRFYILADDGVKLWIDYPPDKRPTLDTYNAPRPGETLTADVTLSAGSHHIQIDFRENTETAYLYISWESLDDGVQGPGFTPPPIPVHWQVQWAAQYYNNVFLGGLPALSQSEPFPSHNWGAGSPGAGVVADYFSARWVLYQEFEAATYKIEVLADDGVRVNVDGLYVINEWHDATGETYSATFPLSAGPHSITVEFYEASGAAYLDFRMYRLQEEHLTQAQATVTAWRLNVRNAPFVGDVLTKISRGETYPVVGRNADSSWWQISVNGLIGWVSGKWVTVTAPESVPVTDLSTAAQPTPAPATMMGQCPGFLPSRLSPNSWGRVLPGLPNNLRAQPNLNATLIGQIPPGAVFQVLGGPVCADSTAWYQVYYNGIMGWTAEGQGTAYWLEPYTP